MKKTSLYEGTTGERIKYLRNKYGISQKDLAALVGYRRSSFIWVVCSLYFG